MIDRRLLLAATAMLLGAPHGRRAAAQGAFPDRPIRLVTSATPGSAADIIARLTAEAIGPVLGQTVTVENRTGAGGAVGAEFVVRSRPDGYTLMVGNQATHSINPLINRLTFDPVTDTRPIAAVAGVPSVFVVAAQFPARTLPEFIELARRQPGQLAYGSAGVGTSTHMTMALFAHRAGLQLEHVPYRGTPLAIPDILAGRLFGMMDTVPAAMPHIREGRMRALAVATAERVPLLPDVPTVAEAALPGFGVLNWNGIAAPRDTPDAVVQVLHRAIGTALATPAFRERLESQGMQPLPMTTEQFAAFIEADRQVWAELVRVSGIRGD